MELKSLYYDNLIACHECDAVHEVLPLEHGQSAQCSRCGASLYKEVKNSLDRTLGFSVTGVILFIIANSFPLMSFQLQGRTQENTLMSGVVEFFQVGFWELGVLVFIVSIVMPIFYLTSIIYVLLPIKFNRHPWGMTTVFKWVNQMRPWAMAEVFMLGALVAFVKLSDFATIAPGIAFFALTALIIIVAIIGTTLDSRIVWQRLKV